MKQQGLCHLKCSKWEQSKQSYWSGFIGWSNQAIWLVHLLSLWRGFEKYFRLRETKFPFLKSSLWLISFICGQDTSDFLSLGECFICSRAGPLTVVFIIHSNLYQMSNFCEGYFICSSTYSLAALYHFTAKGQELGRKRDNFQCSFSPHLVSAEGRRFTIVREGIDQIFADFACNLHFCPDWKWVWLLWRED